MALHERVRLLQPPAHVRSTSDDICVKAVDFGGTLDRAERDVEAVRFKGLGDPLGDALGRTVAGRVRDEDLHDLLLPPVTRALPEPSVGTAGEGYFGL